HADSALGETVGPGPHALHEPQAGEGIQPGRRRVADHEHLDVGGPGVGVDDLTARQTGGELRDPPAAEASSGDVDADDAHTGGSPGTGTGPTSSPSTSFRGMPSRNKRASR